MKKKPASQDENHAAGPLAYRSRKSPYRHLILPAMVVLVVLTIFPLLYSLFISITNYTLTIPGSDTVIGLRNYVEAFKSPDFRNALLNTVKIAVPALLIETVLGFALATLFNRPFFGRGFFLALMATPFMIAPGAGALAWRLLFDPRYGPINDLLSRLIGHPITIDWLGSTQTAIWSLVIVDVWQTTPFIMLIMLAGLSGISPELYEAARIDGSGQANTFFRITLPMVRPVLTVAMLFRSIDLVKMFDMCYSLTKGGPAKSTETISFYTYQQGLAFTRVGYGAAISFIVLILFSVLAVAYIRASMQSQQEGER